ncbi:hypothetical protein A2397_04025 [Candidatus Amesbacteria bacterium RIFOXYB1_FULL_44_23]|uniref:Serine aminopeptidase S33 domain-containing protein n=1 Tax=Candidatus Amesbacteria bacterium RIFOXYB1_FULL_44_23 TaxID=1797263 RepID=A0A1F4ZT08_9BACT|nr:MAG: hypothetical protein A2397_04025 [Candidatus Amesbacteria bacterium RIFOXYB1_FULL_44_23]
MKWILVFVVGFIAGLVITYFPSSKTEKLPVAEVEEIQPLLKYTIENLGMREYQSEIVMDEIAATEAAFFVQKFHFDSDGKNVSGLAHIPNSCDKCPTIVQFRGYADPTIYQSGYGTWRSAQEFAKAGFISLAPDFLGYGESASPSADVFEARFETYTTALNLLVGVEKWEKSNGKVGIWGHSNGGQIALTILEISQKEYPTVLWAPVTAGFPYSILFYMNDNEEGDKNLRKKLVDFESIYDTGLFNLLNYVERIKAQLQLHQGTGDVSVPVGWNRGFAKKIPGIVYFEYSGADHNLQPGWNLVVERDIDFFRKNLFNPVSP